MVEEERARQEACRNHRGGNNECHQVAPLSIKDDGGVFIANWELVAITHVSAMGILIVVWAGNDAIRLYQVVHLEPWKEWNTFIRLLLSLRTSFQKGFMSMFRSATERKPGKSA